MLPSDHQAPWRLRLDDLASVEDLAIAGWLHGSSHVGKGIC
jgi:hypothetical protein